MSIDFSTDFHYVLALLPEIALCIAGMVVLLMGVWSPSESSSGDGAGSQVAGDPGMRGLEWITLLGVATAAALNAWLYSAADAPSDAMIAVDGFRLFGNWVFLISLALAVLVSPAYIYRQRLQRGEFYALLLFATAGMMVMVAARDLILIFLGLELMSVAVYALAAFNRRDRKSAESGLKYFLLGAFSSGFFLYGIALAYGATGSVNIADIAASVGSGSADPVLLGFGVALLLIGFAFKVSAVPLHMWTPDVYEGAPGPVTAYMSVAVKAAAFLTFLRVFAVAFGDVYESWGTAVWWLAAVTMVVANLTALVQHNIKRMLAYSSVAHAGYLLVALVAFNEAAASGLLFYVAIYTFMNLGAFAIVILMARQGEDRLHLEDYAGFGWERPFLGVILTVFLLSLAGFPGTGGFIAKIQLLIGAADAELWSLAVVLVLTTVVSYAYYLKVAWYAWMRPARTHESHDDLYLPTSMRLALVVAVVVVLYTGVLPGGLLDLARESVGGLLSIPGSGVSAIP